MNVLLEQTATEVWVARGIQHDWTDLAAHPQDREAAQTLPQWRIAEFLSSRALLRHLLRETLPELAESPVRKDRHGRPSLEGHPQIGISISHDGESVAVAVAPHRLVGIDVQVPPGTVSVPMLRRCLRTHAPDVAALPERQRAVEFSWVWTVQEACVKAAGTGLSGRPWSIDVPPGRLRGRWGDFEWVSLRDTSPVPLSCAFSVPRDEEEARCT